MKSLKNISMYLLTVLLLLSCTKPESKFQLPDFDGITTTILSENTNPFFGFGYNQYPPDLNARGEDNYVWTDERYKMMEERIKAIHPGLVRMPVSREWYNKTTTPGGYDFILGDYDWETPQMQCFYKFMDLYKEMGVKVLSGWWHVTDYYTDAVGFKDNNNVQAFAEFINYMINVKGYDNIIYMQPANEPYGTATAFGDWSKFMKKTYDYCIDKGYPHDRLCGPDSWDFWIYRAVLSNSREMASYNFHFYFDGISGMAMGRDYVTELESQVKYVTDNDNSNKPIVCAECGAINGGWLDWPTLKPENGAIYSFSYIYAIYMAEYAIHSMKLGIASSLSWGLHGFDQNKDGGMWNNTGQWGGLKLRPLYYVWSMLCRYFPDGGVPLQMSWENGKVKVGGCRIGASDYSFVICNIATYAEQIRIELPAAANNKKFYFYHFTENHQGNGSELQLPCTEIVSSNNSISIEVNKNSVGFISSLPPLTLN